MVLSRRQGESLVIGPDIRVTVTNVVNGKVSLSIDAPKTTLILRSELIKNDDDPYLPPERRKPKKVTE